MMTLFGAGATDNADEAGAAAAGQGDTGNSLTRITKPASLFKGRYKICDPRSPRSTGPRCCASGPPTTSSN